MFIFNIIFLLAHNVSKENSRMKKYSTIFRLKDAQYNGVGQTLCVTYSIVYAMRLQEL